MSKLSYSIEQRFTRTLIHLQPTRIALTLKVVLK